MLILQSLINYVIIESAWYQAGTFITLGLMQSSKNAINYEAFKENMTTQISIIINNYNYGRFLAHAIESVLQQSYPYIQLIVVDDGSNDESCEVIARYSSQLRAIFKSHGGQASALNAGFAQAHGDIIIFLDADDQLHSDAASMIVRTWAQNPGLARMHYRMDVIDQHGNATGIIKPALHIPMPSGNLQNQVLSFPDDMGWLPTSGNAYSARVLQRIFPIPEEKFQILADCYLNHVTPLFGRVIAIEHVCASYRMHGGNNHEQGQLNLHQIRRSLLHWHASHQAIKHFAAELHMPSNTLSPVTYAAHRLISLRLDPHQHPFSNDNSYKALWSGWGAALQRFDTAWPMRLLFMIWFLCMAIAPIRLACWLAQQWLYPESRPSFNRVLRYLHHDIHKNKAVLQCMHVEQDQK